MSAASSRAISQTYEWFCSSPFADAPDAMSDPVWGAGYDFAAEARALARL